jgi:hypothetical protein
MSDKQRKAIGSLDKLLGSDTHPLRSAFIENMRKRS